MTDETALNDDGFAHDCPPSSAGHGDVVCSACGTAWRWVEETPSRSYWMELTPAKLTAERDRARDVAVALEQQTAEALRLALLPLDGYDLSENFDQMPWAMRALRRIVCLLGDETETQQ